jgi:transposase
VLDATSQLRQSKSIRKVAQSLGISKSSVARIRDNDKENIPPPNPGRPRAISERTRSALAHHYDIGDLKRYKDGQRFVQSAVGKQIHISTVRQNLLQEGVRTSSQPKKPNLTRDQRARRLEFAKADLVFVEIVLGLPGFSGGMFSLSLSLILATEDFEMPSDCATFLIDLLCRSCEVASSTFAGGRCFRLTMFLSFCQVGHCKFIRSSLTAFSW